MGFFTLAISLCYQDIQERFAGSMLGTLWIFIWPVIQLFIYIVIFGKLMGTRLGMHSGPYAYGLYIASGLLSWTYFAASLARSSRSMLDKRNIMRKVRVNPAIFPAVACLAELLPFIGGFILLFIVDLLTGWRPAIGWLALCLLALYMQTILAYGLGLFFACVAVFARDIAEAVSICLQMAFWFTPIVYMPSILPDWLANILWINPMLAIIGIFQQCFVLGGSIRWPIIVYAFIMAHLALLLGLWTLRHWRKDILDVL